MYKSLFSDLTGEHVHSCGLSYDARDSLTKLSLRDTRYAPVPLASTFLFRLTDSIYRSDVYSVCSLFLSVEIN